MANFKREMTEKEQSMLDIYRDRIHMSQDRFRMKWQQMAEAKQAYKQYLPADSIATASDANEIIGNATRDPNAATDEKDERRDLYNSSAYIVPLTTSLVDAHKKELQAHNATFESEANTPEFESTRRAVESNMSQVFSYQEIKKKIGYFVEYFSILGTGITQTVPVNISRKVIMPDGTTKTFYDGKGIDIKVYDPSIVMLDYNSDPMDVSNTAQWAIVTLGYYASDYVKERWGVEVQGSTVDKYEIDQLQRQAELDSGMDKYERVAVREYYLNDGHIYMVFGDEKLYDAGVNSNGITDRIPLNVSKLFYDPDCVYGEVSWFILKPSIELASKALNMICDNNARNNNSPIFTYEGSGLDMTMLNEAMPNEIVKLTLPSPMKTGGMANINNLISKIQFPDVTQGAVFMFNTAINFAFQVYGMSPLDFGQQEKQIRTNDVAQLVGQSSLRNSSNLVIKFENEFMNPTTKDILQIMWRDFDSFVWPEDVTQDKLKSMRGLRVANGSYLPSDQMTRQQKMAQTMQLAQVNPNAFDLEKVYYDYLQAFGITDPDVYLLDPMEKLQQAGLVQLVALAQQYGAEGLMQFIGQIAPELQQATAPQGGQA